MFVKSKIDFIIIESFFITFKMGRFFFLFNIMMKITFIHLCQEDIPCWHPYHYDIIQPKFFYIFDKKYI